MVDYHSTLVAALQLILPTYYEKFLHSGLEVPCISYQETNNYNTNVGDTLGYSRITYTIKVWGNDIAELQRYALEIDAVLRPLGWNRVSSNELSTDTMTQKIMTFECLALETF